MMLVSSTIPIEKLTAQNRTDMLRLMQEYYQDVLPEQFTADLEAKNWIIMLHSGAELGGFSTQSLRELELDGRGVRVLFSGDTIIAEQYRNSLVLPLAWGRMMLLLLAESPATPLYWLLTSKGYKTYRFLTVFFNDFSPSPGRNRSPWEQSLVSSVISTMYNGRFDPERGIIRAGCCSQRLRPGAADITDSRRQMQDVAYFEQLNPGHISGDELVCLARFEESNLKPFILKRLLA
jgi:hypothetical protein